MSTSYRYRSGRTARFRRARGTLVVAAFVVASAAGGAFVMHQPSGKVAGASTVATAAERNQTRRLNLTRLADALAHYRSVHAVLPLRLSFSPIEICSASPLDCRGTGLADLNFIVSSNDLSSVPTDPIGGPGRFGSGFTIAKDSTGHFILNAPRAEDGVIISLTK